jgi:hypothetical protein
MEQILQIIGSVASIGSIPLAIYLFLKNAAEKHLAIRRDIVNRLSFQIGEGRDLSLFEIQAVIDSKIRESRIKPGTIRVHEIVEDLVTQTVNSPLLESAKKAAIITSLSDLHALGRLHGIVSGDTRIFEDFVSYHG